MEIGSDSCAPNGNVEFDLILVVVENAESVASTTELGTVPETEVFLSLDLLDPGVHHRLILQVGIDQTEVIISEYVRSSIAKAQAHEDVSRFIASDEIFAPSVVVEDGRRDVDAVIGLAGPVRVHAILKPDQVMDQGRISTHRPDKQGKPDPAMHVCKCVLRLLGIERAKAS